jgi:hypothetical protein
MEQLCIKIVMCTACDKNYKKHEPSLESLKILTKRARSWILGFLLPSRFLSIFKASFACLQDKSNSEKKQDQHNLRAEIKMNRLKDKFQCSNIKIFGKINIFIPALTNPTTHTT